MGPFLGVTLVQIVTYPQLFGICLAVGCVSLVCYVMLRVPNRLPGSEASSKDLLDLRNYIDYSVIPFACVVLVAAICWGNVQAFITFYAKELGLMGAASLFFLLYALTLILTRPASGKIYDMRGENVVVVPCLLLTALGLFLLGHAVANWSMLLAGVLLGLGFGNFQSVAQAISLSLVPRERYAQATSTFFIFFDFGMGFGPYAFGTVASHAGYDGLLSDAVRRGAAGARALHPAARPQGGGLPGLTTGRTPACGQRFLHEGWGKPQKRGRDRMDPCPSVFSPRCAAPCRSLSTHILLIIL